MLLDLNVCSHCYFIASVCFLPVRHLRLIFRLLCVHVVSVFASLCAKSSSYHVSNVPAFFPSCWTALIRPVLLVLVSRCSHRCYSAVSVWSSVHRTLLPHCTHGLQSCALQFKAKMLRFSYFIVLYCKICLFMCHSKSARKRSPVNKVARSLEKNKTKIMKYLQQFSVALHYIMLIVVFVVTEETLWGQEMRTFIYLFIYFAKII